MTNLMNRVGKQGYILWVKNIFRDKRSVPGNWNIKKMCEFLNNPIQKVCSPCDMVTKINMERYRHWLEDTVWLDLRCHGYIRIISFSLETTVSCIQFMWFVDPSVHPRLLLVSLLDPFWQDSSLWLEEPVYFTSQVHTPTQCISSKELTLAQHNSGV